MPRVKQKRSATRISTEALPALVHCGSVEEGWELFARLHVNGKEGEVVYEIARITFYSGAAMLMGLRQRVEDREANDPERLQTLWDDLARELYSYFETAKMASAIDWQRFVIPPHGLCFDSGEPHSDDDTRTWVF